jgi:MurNAc alpha-1-phosphate uridylyltransferase
MVPNPDHNPRGDFSLAGARIREHGDRPLTFSGIGVYNPRLFEGCKAGKFSVVPLLRAAMERHLVTGEEFRGGWNDIGTLERLEAARKACPLSR